MYELREPAAPLRRFIEHYWFVTSDDGPVDLRVDVFVDGRADLIFNFGAPYRREVIGGAAVEHVRSNLDAQRMVPIRIVQRGDVRIAGVRFRLGGLGPFARAPLARVTGGTPEPQTVLGPDAAPLEAALHAAPGPDGQAALLDRFFTERLSLDGSFETFGTALSALTGSHGGASVESVASGVGISARHLDRLFARHLGIPPKSVARVLRFQRVLRALMQDPGVSLATVAADAGYFDQAHFIKDFKRMSGGVPRGYRGYYPPAGPNDFAPNVVVFLQER